MAVRRESVVLDLDDRLTPGLIRAAAAAGVLDRELNKLGGQSVRTSRSVSQAETEVRNLGNTAGGSTRQIDRYSGRIGLLGDAILTLGPAAVTMGATAVPVVAALGSELGFTAVGAGTAVLAFKGLGTALTAFNKAAAAPTATNIAAAQAAMDKIPPSAQRFVLELHRLNPEMSKLREAAGAGLFDGLTSGIHAAERDLPIAQRALRGVSLELGNLADKAGHSLASAQWRPFLRFVGTEAPQALDDMGHATGSVAHGLAGLWMAFGQENRTLSAGIVGLAHDFDQWANSVGRTQGFQDFLAYVNENGPRVLDLLGQVGMAFVDIGTAAAPIGGPVLDVLTRLFEIIDQIAKSDFGTPLLAGIIAFRLYARAAALAGVQVDMSFKAMAQAPTQMSAGLTALQAKTAGWARATVADIGVVTRSWMTAGAMSQREAALQGGAMGRLRGTAGSALKGGAAAAGIALVASGAADKIGLANTASLALMGTLAGPFGAAVGGTIGLFSDWRSAVSDTDSAVKSLQRTTDSFDLSSANQQVEAMQANLDSLSGAGILSHPASGIDLVAHLFGGQDVMDKQIAALGKAKDAIAENRAALTDLFGGFGGTQPTDDFGRSMVLTTEQLANVASRAQPAMTALGISVGDLQAASRAGDGSLGDLVSQIVDWTNHADSAAGRSEAVSKAFAEMGNDALTADDRVQGLTDALDGLIDPMMQLGQAKDAFHKGLNDLNGSLAKGSHELKGFSNAAVQNREAIRGQVTNLKAMIEAQARAGVSGPKMAATLRDGRKAIIDAAEAAGLNRQKVQQMIDTMGLTPKQIKTLITVDAGQALSQARAVASALAALRDKTIRITTVRTTGGHSVAGNADGGFIRGPGGPRDDVIPAWLSNGEFVVNAAATARNLSLLHSINAQKFADGGQASTSSSPNHLTPAEKAQQRADDRHIKELQHSIDKLQKSVDKDRQSRDDLRQQEQQIASTVAGSFRSDLFASAGVWSAAASPDSILKGDIRSATKFNRALHKAARKGLSGGAFEALAESGNLQAALFEANRSRGELRHTDALFRRRQRITNRVGGFAGDVVVGHRLDKANDLLDRANKHLQRMEQEMKHLRAEAKHHAKATGDAVGDKINGSASTAKRRARTR